MPDAISSSIHQNAINQWHNQLNYKMNHVRIGQFLAHFPTESNLSTSNDLTISSVRTNTGLPYPRVPTKITKHVM